MTVGSEKKDEMNDGSVAIFRAARFTAASSILPLGKQKNAAARLLISDYRQ